MLGKDFKLAREGMGLTQRQLAAILEKNVKTIHNWETAVIPLKRYISLAMEYIKSGDHLKN